MIKVIMDPACESFPGFGVQITAIGELVWQERGKVVRRRPFSWETRFDGEKGEWDAEELHERWSESVWPKDPEPTYAMIQHWIAHAPLRIDSGTHEEDGDIMYRATLTVTASDEKTLEAYVGKPKVVAFADTFEDAVRQEVAKRLDLPVKRPFAEANEIPVKACLAGVTHSDLLKAFNSPEAQSIRASIDHAIDALRYGFERGHVAVDDRTGAVRVLTGEEVDSVGTC